MEVSVDISPALAKFSVSLYKTVSKNVGPSENFCVSPFSVAAVLSMAHVGAKSNTALEMASALHLTEFEVDQISKAMGKLCHELKDDKTSLLKTTNQIYVAHKYQLTEQFQKSMENHFGAPAENVDFESDEVRLNINKKIADYTNQKIKDLIPLGSFNASTRLTLVNAVYFNGNWQNTFDVDQTRLEPFHLGSIDSKVNVDMMHNEGKFNSGYIDALDARILKLPYLGHRLNMFIILPNKIDGLAAVESKLGDMVLDDVLFETVNAEMEVAIPKFKVEANVEMKNVLMQMGMSDLFDPSKADLSGISGSKDLFVSSVIHKAFIDVNEKGSEAAAATAMIMCTSCWIPDPVVPPAPFVADHPFIYLIRDNWTGLVLFIGKFTSPPS